MDEGGERIGGIKQTGRQADRQVIGVLLTIRHIGLVADGVGAQVEELDVAVVVARHNAALVVGEGVSWVSE
jgi:hypothetical protein